MGNYNDRLLDDCEQFFYLCGEKDQSVLGARIIKDKIGEFARLACIALVFDYRTVFLHILGITEKYYDEFIKGLDRINGNFHLLDEWVENFLKNIQIKEARDLAQEFWQERKKTLDRSDLLIKHLFENF